MTTDYAIRTGLSKSVETVRVTSRVPIAGDYGFALTSTFGPSNLLWKGNTLLASNLGGTRFSPPIPILINGDPSATRRTKTRATWGGLSEPADIILTQSKETVRIGNTDVDGIRVTLTLQTPTREVQTISVYAPGKGLVHQQQLTNGRFDLSLDRLDM
jgi:hypothetical protein